MEGIPAYFQIDLKALKCPGIIKFLSLDNNCTVQIYISTKTKRPDPKHHQTYEDKLELLGLKMPQEYYMPTKNIGPAPRWSSENLYFSIHCDQDNFVNADLKCQIKPIKNKKETENLT